MGNLKPSNYPKMHNKVEAKHSIPNQFLSIITYQMFDATFYGQFVQIKLTLSCHPDEIIKHFLPIKKHEFYHFVYPVGYKPKRPEEALTR